MMWAIRNGWIAVAAIFLASCGGGSSSTTSSTPRLAELPKKAP
jgi:hypothetical protein